MSDVPISSAAREMVRSPANELVVGGPIPGFYLMMYLQNVPSPYALSDYNATLASVLSGIAAVDITVPATGRWMNNISGDPNYWSNFSNSGLPPPNNKALPTYPPFYWETYFDTSGFLDQSLFPFFGTGIYTLPSGGLGIGMQAGVLIQTSFGIGGPGRVIASRWRINGYAPSTLTASLIHSIASYPTGSPTPPSDGYKPYLSGGNNVLEGTTTISPIGSVGVGNIYALDGVNSIGSLSIPNSTNPFSIQRGYWVYTLGFDGASPPPSTTDPTVTVTANPSNASCVHNSTSAVFTCAGTIPGGLGYVLGYNWCYSQDAGVNWQTLFGSEVSGQGTNTLTYTPTFSGTALNGSLIKCQLYTNAGMKSTLTATLTVT